MSKTPNQNFLDDEEEIEYEEVPEDEITDADEVLDEVEEEIQSSSRATQQISKAFSEAEKRIEQANLYKAILNSNLFGKGSARPEIIKVVDKEFKEFVMYRLEVLLGIKTEGGVRGAQPVQAALPFNQSEIAALKDIARKLVARQGPTAAAPQVATPTIQPIMGNQEQTIEPVTEDQEQEEAPQRQVRMVKRVVSRTRNGQPVQAKPKRAPKPKTNNVSEITGQDLGQASLPERPPVRMPSASMMNAMNAEIAEKNARGGMQATGGMLSAHLKSLVKG